MRGSRPKQDASSREKRRAIPKKVCRFCSNKNLVIDYKSSDLLRIFVTDRGKIIPRRINGNCSKHQRDLTVAIKRARHLALMPFAVR